MKTSTGLLILIAIMHFITLSNIPLFDGRWNGIAMWLNTGLFIAAIAFYFLGRTNSKSQVL
jgi:hypothetical protein